MDGIVMARMYGYDLEGDSAPLLNWEEDRRCRKYAARTCRIFMYMAIGVIVFGLIQMQESQANESAWMSQECSVCIF